jgi:hypothetical protein
MVSASTIEDNKATWIAQQRVLAWIVAPALPQSGQGGRSYFTTEGNLTGPSQYDIVPKGAPSVSDP